MTRRVQSSASHHSRFFIAATIAMTAFDSILPAITSHSSRGASSIVSKPSSAGEGLNLAAFEGLRSRLARGARPVTLLQRQHYVFANSK